MKTVSSNSPPRHVQTVFMTTGIGVHDRPDSVFTINWIECSRSNGIGVHDRPDFATLVCAILTVVSIALSLLQIALMVVASA